MAANERRRNAVIAIIVIAILIILMLLLVRCPAKQAVTSTTSSQETLPTPADPAVPQGPSTKPIETPPADEQLTPGTVTVPQTVDAGAEFTVDWTGPNNPHDYVTIVRPDANAQDYGDYKDTDKGSPLILTAPIEPGTYEVRYVTNRTRTILARAAIRVEPVAASVSAPNEVVAGARIEVSWTGPNNNGDYITVVMKQATDNQYGDYAYTNKGSPSDLLTPIEPGEAEVRYVSGQGPRVLARRDLKLVAPKVTLSAPSQGAAGTEVEVTWTGPNNGGDYLTAVSKTTPDGQYGEYTYTTAGTPLKLRLPAEAGDAEIRYMTGQGGKVLARVLIRVLPN